VIQRGERFLIPERIWMPDIDMDFDDVVTTARETRGHIMSTP
jgi:hypothetical protein